MQTIEGKIRNIIYTSETGFFVGVLKVKDTKEEDLKDLIHKTITVTGLIVDANEEDTYILHGTYQKHERYGYQFQFQSYEKKIPEGKDAIIEFLSSPLIRGCGIKTAKEIVDTLGENALDLIKENKSNLYLVPNMTEKKATNIYLSVLSYSQIDDTLITLKNLGFTMPEATKLVKIFHDKTLVYLEENIYFFKEYVPFTKLDKIFLKNHDPDDEIRIEECLKEGMEELSTTKGDIYYLKEEIAEMAKKRFGIYLEEDTLEQVLQTLHQKKEIKIEQERIYLLKYYDMECQIAEKIKKRVSLPSKEIPNIEEKIKNMEGYLQKKYNKDQKNAIATALKNNISIISGGPGTGKTTIVNAITKLYIEIYHLSPIDTLGTIALIAPTGRAAKKLAMSTNLPAMTIHRYLKWNKDTNEFGINETNKNHQKLIIVDETSMIDTYLFSSLLNGIEENSQLILVGDTFQLPSVGAGLILNDLVDSKVIAFTSLETIYRQSENSYIPILAKEIKEHHLSESYLKKKDDYNFLPCESRHLKDALKQIIEKSLQKGLKKDDIQVLAPMYKGENGIDNLNLLLQELLNPTTTEKKEYPYFDVIYREKDRVLQLVNNPDANVYNGDIGFIESIKEVLIPKKHIEIQINFDGNRVIYQKEDLNSIKHAYAITIHKSQGSEFPIVILPISKNYYKMLYNKLVYTGVSRAKECLILLGEKESFLMAIQNDYSLNRKTSLLERLTS